MSDMGPHSRGRISDQNRPASPNQGKPGAFFAEDLEYPAQFQMDSAANSMIAKTLFLTKIIHRIGTQNLHDKKSLRENQAIYRTFFVKHSLSARNRGTQNARIRIYPDTGVPCRAVRCARRAGRAPRV
jgi:hypothetical protein